MDDKISLDRWMTTESRIATIEAQYKQLFDLLERHNDVNEKLEKKLEKIEINISKLGWYIALTMFSVVMSIVIPLVTRG